MNNPATVLITGASSGIGLEFAKVFAKNKYNLILVARNTTAMEELAKSLQGEYNTKSIIITKDLSKPTAPQEMYDELNKKKIHVDILINNAGFANYGKFELVELTKQEQLIAVNIQALTTLTKLFLKDMREANSGKILNIASTAGFLPGPLMATYYASKAYVVSFSQALSNELEGTGVSVTCLCPGLTKTGFEKRAGLEQSKLFQGSQMSPKKVASIGFDALMNNKPLVITGMLNNLMVFGSRFTPRAVILRAVRYVQEQR